MTTNELPRERSELDRLVIAARDGDRPAFDELVRRTYVDTYTLAMRLTAHEEDARDVVQETYLRAWKGLKGFRGDAQFTTWLYRITANTAYTTMPRDGSALVSTNSAIFIEPLLGGKGAQFDARKFSWIGGTHDTDYRETWSAFRRRTLGVIERLTIAAEVTDHCLVFTSGGTIATICCDLLGAPDRKVPALAYELANSSITRLRFRGGRVMLSTLNGTPHLDRSHPQHITYR